MKLFKAALLVAGLFSVAESRVNCTSSNGQIMLLSEVPPNCTHCRNRLRIDGTGDVTLGALETVDGNIILQGESDITSISAPALTQLSNLKLSNSSNLKSLNFPVLSFVGENIELINNPALGSVNFPALVFLRAFQVTRCGVAQIDVPELVTAYGNLPSDPLRFAHNPNLVTINLQSLQMIEHNITHEGKIRTMNGSQTAVVLNNNTNLKLINICSPTERIYDENMANESLLTRIIAGHPVVDCVPTNKGTTSHAESVSVVRPVTLYALPFFLSACYLLV